MPSASIAFIDARRPKRYVCLSGRFVPLVAGIRKREPVVRVGEDSLHFFGVPYR